MEAGRISTGMTEKKRTLLDIALADRAGRAAVRIVEKGLVPNLAIGRLVYRERRWMEEGL